MATTMRLTGWTAIEVAERGGRLLAKAADPTEGAREGLSVAEAREVAAEDPGLVYLDVPVSNGRVDVGGGRVWLDHPERGWIEMPSRYSTEGITEEDLVQDSQLRRLSDREVRTLHAGLGEEARFIVAWSGDGAPSLIACGPDRFVEQEPMPRDAAIRRARAARAEYKRMYRLLYADREPPICVLEKTGPGQYEVAWDGDAQKESA